MKKVIAVAALVLVAGSAQARDQRENCNQKAAGITGTERSQLIAECIQRNARVSTMPPTLARMSQCNREAGDMTGDARVRFVNTCMERAD